MIFIIILIETLYLMYKQRGKLKPMSIMYMYNQVAMALSLFVLFEIMILISDFVFGFWFIWVIIIGGIYLIINIVRLINILVHVAKTNHINDIPQ